MDRPRGAAVAGGSSRTRWPPLLPVFDELRLITPPLRILVGIITGASAFAGSGGCAGAVTPHRRGGVRGRNRRPLCGLWAAHILYAPIPLAAAFALMARHDGLLHALGPPRLVRSVHSADRRSSRHPFFHGRTDHPSAYSGTCPLDVGSWPLTRLRWPWLGLGGWSYGAPGRSGSAADGRGLRRPGASDSRDLRHLVHACRPARAAVHLSKEQWLVTQAGSVLAPFAFAVYFAGRVELGLARDARRAPDTADRRRRLIGQRRRYRGSGSAQESRAAVVGVWLSQHEVGLTVVAGCGPALALSAIFHMFVE